MTDIPIIFSAAMVRALLAGQKTQTRRLAERWVENKRGCRWEPSQWRKVRPGDRLWVRENILQSKSSRSDPSGEAESYWHSERIEYCADTPEPQPRFLRPEQYGSPWMGRRPAIHMPRSASRITLTVTEQRVQKLHDITEDGALAEGIVMENVIVGANCNGGVHVEESADRYFFDGCNDEGFEDGISAYAALWTKLHGAGAWEKNPEIVAITFRAEARNIDAEAA